MDYEELNRRLNISLRSISAASVVISSGQAPFRRDAIVRISEAVASIDGLQRMLFEIKPELEYHFEENRDPTEFMRAVGSRVKLAAERETKGDIEGALSALDEALAMEPPPLPYQKIIERRDRLESMR